MEVKPGYKLTEVGVIPEDWEATTIGDVCAFSGGSQPPRFTFRFAPTAGYVRLIQIRDYKSDEYVCYISELLARKRCTADDIMIGRYGPPIFQILRGIEGAYNVAPIKATPNQRADREFFLNVLKQESLFQLIDALSRRSSGQTGVEMPALKAYGLPLPPIAEQRAIAAALSDVDALLGGLERLIAKKRDFKQADMQQLLTGQTRLPGFKGEWEVKRLGDIGTFLKGSGVRKDEAHSGNLPCIRYGEIYTHHNDHIKRFNSWISAEVAATSTRLKHGDLLFAGSGATKEEIGKCVAFVDGCEAYAGGDTVFFDLLA
ncbi:MAG: restriction endonuclease subunit S [Candidatus Competibacter sp.]|nr:restriction endonuclease subunit S [Candidatus Competibacter sp.]HRD49589.1 restriction endonuclease subunit S [Candidatus Contendobacter sp.]